jgi:hypothetical protein
MNLKKSLHTLAFAACLAGLANFAQAETYSNVDTNSATIYFFGAPDTTSYGQYFSSPGGILDSFTFYAANGSAGNVELTVAAWDGSKAVGSALYTTDLYYAGGSQALSAGSINLALAENTQYIVYLTVAGVDGAAAYVSFQGASGNGGLDGSFSYLNSSGVDPLTLSETWDSNWTPANLSYTANFTSAVPEPETLAMLLAGLGLVGFMKRRQSLKA